MAKKVVGYIKLQVPAGKANPSPPIGPALGQRGLNIMEFCKSFNAQTQGMEPGLPIPVVITAFADKSFTFVMKTPPATVLIKKAAKVEKGSSKPHTDKVGKITRSQAEDVAKAKMPDLTAANLEAAVKTIAGSARANCPDSIPRRIASRSSSLYSSRILRTSAITSSEANRTISRANATVAARSCASAYISW